MDCEAATVGVLGVKVNSGGGTLAVAVLVVPPSKSAGSRIIDHQHNQLTSLAVMGILSNISGS